MKHIFYYISLISLPLGLLTVSRFKKLRTSNVMVGVITAVVSIAYDVILGGYFNLYYYISPKNSLVYMVVAGILIYPAANIIYTLFLPSSTRDAVMYTIIWIGLMLLFEYASILSGTIVLTGWVPFPWSVITYAATYLWVNTAYRYMLRLSKNTATA